MQVLALVGAWRVVGEEGAAVNLERRARGRRRQGPRCRRTSRRCNASRHRGCAWSRGWCLGPSCPPRSHADWLCPLARPLPPSTAGCRAHRSLLCASSPAVPRAPNVTFSFGVANCTMCAKRVPSGSGFPTTPRAPNVYLQVWVADSTLCPKLVPQGWGCQLHHVP